MKKYPKYKPSNIDWIGDIPEHWEVKVLKRLAKICNGQDHKKVWDSNGSFPIIGTGGTFGYTNSYLHEGPSVILGRKGTIDKPQYMEAPFWSVDTAYYTDIFPSTNPRYFYHLCNTINFELYKYGSAVPSMSQEVLNQIPFSIPNDFEEQTAIANYLDKKTLEIDQLIDDKKKLIQLFEEEKTTIISQFVTKGLNYSVKMIDSGIEWIGEIPMHWGVKKLKHLSKVQTGRTPKIQSSSIDFFENGTINWFTPSDFKSNKEVFKSKRRIIEEAVLQNEVELFPEKSIYLVSIGATLGKISFCSTKASANQQINVISFNDKILNPRFGYYYLIGCKEILLLEADYTTLPILNQTKTKNLFLVVPPINEQEKIVNHIELELRRIDSKIKKTKKLIDLLTEYRSALISEVVTGKVKVID